MEFTFDYLKCSKCEKKESCDICERNLEENLLLEPEIRYINAQIRRNTLSVSSQLEWPVLEKLLQKYGISAR